MYDTLRAFSQADGYSMMTPVAAAGTTGRRIITRKFFSRDKLVWTSRVQVKRLRHRLNFVSIFRFAEKCVNVNFIFCRYKFKVVTLTTSLHRYTDLHVIFLAAGVVRVLTHSI